jgi:hypothetical protein
MIESMNANKLSANIHPMKMRVAQGRPGIFQLKYAGKIQSSSPINEKVVNGMSAMTSKNWVEVGEGWQGVYHLVVYKRHSRYRPGEQRKGVVKERRFASRSYS